MWGYDCWAYTSSDTPPFPFENTNWGIVDKLDDSHTNWYTPNYHAWFMITDKHPMPAFFETNVTQNFINWFAVGFILQCIIIAMNVFSGIGVVMKSNQLLKCSCGIVGLVQCIGGLLWFIWGQILRWRLSGKICSGDSMVPEKANLSDGWTEHMIPFELVPGALNSSGKLMQTIIICIYSSCGLCCLLTVVGAGCMKK